MDDDAPRGQAMHLAQRPAAPVEEDDVEGEAHPKCVDCGAARDQQPRSGALRAQQSKPEQPCAQTPRHRDLVAEHHGPRQAA
jgi:hypothetical protein